MVAETVHRKQLSTSEQRDLWQRFAEDEKPTLLQSYRRASWLTIIFVLAGSLMDFFAYREHWADFLILRIGASVVLAVFYFLFASPALQGHTRLLAHCQALVPTMAINWMIFVIGDSQSPYYAGLSLVLVGSVLMHRWSARDGLINATIVVLSYICVAITISTTMDALVRNIFFLIITAAISCIGLYYYKRLLFEDFCLRAELSITNKDLASALKELGENEARLLHAEKLSSLGRMSAGIVHEINNPLNYTKTALHALRMYSDDLPNGEQKDYLDMLTDADEGVGRVIRIVSDLRSFTVGHGMEMRPVSLLKIIESARRLASDDIREVTFEVEIDASLKIFGNENQLVQVFVNLLQNSGIALHSTSFHGSSPMIRISAESNAKNQVVVRLRDNGCGIAAGDLENIFDPFFTKREIGEGMGLGLSICHRIIEGHNASIEVESEENEYTLFTITFPEPEASTPSSANSISPITAPIE